MAVINHDKREIQFKIVYCGTPQAGKTTNLQYIHRKLDPHCRGDLISIATEDDRTLFFDFLPVNSGRVFGYETRFQLYTVPGQEVYQQTRDILLAGADGVIFVADSDPTRSGANRDALDDCREALVSNGYRLDSMPMAFQFNKCDLRGAMTPEEMDEELQIGVPSFLASAISGYQVFATLDFVTQIVLREFHRSSVVGEGNMASRSTQLHVAERT